MWDHESALDGHTRGLLHRLQGDRGMYCVHLLQDGPRFFEPRLRVHPAHSLFLEIDGQHQFHSGFAGGRRRFWIFDAGRSGHVLQGGEQRVCTDLLDVDDWYLSALPRGGARATS